MPKWLKPTTLRTRWTGWTLFILLAIVIGLVIFYFIKSLPTYSTIAKGNLPVLELPIDLNGKIPETIMPMGETINHEDGHGGIDFMWQNGDDVKIYASMDGKVVSIMPVEKGFDLTTENGKWGIGYHELGSVNPELKVGSIVKTGDFIGIPNHPTDIDNNNPKYRMVHWQFGYVKPDIGLFMAKKTDNKLCPLTYFSLRAKTKIEKLWTDTYWPEMKENAPEICSGKYKRKDK